MVEVSLAEYAQDKSQAEIAKSIGVSREAISQMLQSDREIYIEVDAMGTVKAWEKRSVPARKATAA